MTSRCVFRFDPAAARFNLACRTPGQDRATIRAETGFDYDDSDAPEMPEPSLDELALLRARCGRKWPKPTPNFAHGSGPPKQSASGHSRNGPTVRSGGQPMQSGPIDCDVHPAVPSIAALTPFMDPYWREQIAVRGTDGLDLSSYPIRAPDAARPDWRVAGQKPGTDLASLRRHALDGFGSQIAICNVLYGAPALFNRHFATALARATNDWLAAEFLDREPRLRGSIVVAPQDPTDAVAEIERRASDSRFVQIMLLASGDAPLGQPAYWPIYKAAERHRLPIGVHAGSAYRRPSTGNGWPSYHLEDVVVRAHAFQGQLLSLVHEGAFVKFPALRFVMIEAGFTWLPNFLWRANKTWRGVRAEGPVGRSPTR